MTLLHYCIECAMSTEVDKEHGKELYSTESRPSVLSEEEGLCRGQPCLPTPAPAPVASRCVARQQLKQSTISSYQASRAHGTMPDQHNHFHDITQKHTRALQYPLTHSTPLCCKDTIIAPKRCHTHTSNTTNSIYTFHNRGPLSYTASV